MNDKNEKLGYYAHRMIRLLDHGIDTGDSIRSFDVLDYFDLVNISYDEFLENIKDSISYDDFNMIREFFRRTYSLKDDLDIDSVMNVKDMKVDKDGNKYEILNKNEKKALINYLISNNYPVIKGTYYAARKRFIEGSLILDDYLELENNKVRTR